MQSRGAYMALSIITGLLMIVLGGLFLAQPGLSLASIIWLVGIFAIVYGLFLAIAGIAGRHDGGGWGIAVGVARGHHGHRDARLARGDESRRSSTSSRRGPSSAASPTSPARSWAASAAAGASGWSSSACSGIAVGIYFFVHPVTGVLALLWVVGVYLVVLGVLRIIAGFMQPPRPQAA